MPETYGPGDPGDEDKAADPDTVDERPLRRHNTTLPWPPAPVKTPDADGEASGEIDVPERQKRTPKDARPPSTPFGTLLRANRLGYFPSRHLEGAFIRMSGDSPWLIEVVPVDRPDLLKPGKIDHRLWWELKDEQDPVVMCRPLRKLIGKPVTKYHRFVVTDDGREVRPSNPAYDGFMRALSLR